MNNKIEVTKIIDNLYKVNDIYVIAENESDAIDKYNNVKTKPLTKEDVERWYLYNKRIHELGEPFNGGRVMELEDVLKMIENVKNIKE